MPPNRPSTMNTGMSIAQAFMLILPPESLCLFLPTSSIRVAGGSAFPADSKDIIAEKKDTSHGMIRTEVRSKPEMHIWDMYSQMVRKKGGLRYCINSASLRFIPKEKMKEEGYGEYLPLVK